MTEFRTGFRRQPGACTDLRMECDGQPIDACQDDSVAAALLGAGIVAFGSLPVDGKARGPLCLMGSCYQCLVTIDGVAGRLACQVTATNGMRIERLP